MELIFHTFLLIGSTSEPQYSHRFIPTIVIGAPQFGQEMLNELSLFSGWMFWIRIHILVQIEAGINKTNSSSKEAGTYILVQKERPGRPG